jgi:hypothetical protein
MKRFLLIFSFLVTLCLSAQSEAVNYNAIATAYVTTTISQNVVFNDTMKAGGTFTFSVLAHNGGGRPNESDTANVRIQFYAAGGSLVSSVNSTYNRNLAITSWSAGNPAAQTDVPWSTLTISSADCGGSCANVAYATISMYGVDGSFWAGDYGPWYRAPTFQLNGGSNLAYNPEFGPYNNVTAQGWTASPGFGSCQGAWGGSNPCIVNDQGVPGQSTVGLVANQNGGGPSASGGTTSGQAGGYNSTMSTTNAGAGTGNAAPTTPTVTSTTQSYTSRSVVTNGITYVYRTPTTTTNYSDGTSTTTSGTETLYQIVYPSYVTLGGGSVANMAFGSASPLTTTQQNKVNAWTNKTVTDGNQIHITQIGGDSNTVTMDQTGNKNLINATLQGTNNTITANQGVAGIGQNEMKLNFEGNNNTINLNQGRNTQGNPVGTNGHYLDATVAGWGTSLTVQQTNTGGVGGHYNETTIYGNGNSVTAKQTDNGNKIMFLKVDGALNTVDVVQKGIGQHKLDATLTGNFNSATVLQEGTIANNATLNLTNAGGPQTVNVNQTGGQSVSVTATCATAGGCAPITIRQGY